MEVGEEAAEASGDILPGKVSIRPLRDGIAVLGQALQGGEISCLPIAGADDDGDDASLFGFVALQSTLHLLLVAIVGGEEVGADEQEDEPGLLQVGVDVVGPVVAGEDLAVVPGGDEMLPFER